MNLLNVAYSVPERREIVADAAIRLNIPKDQAKVFQKFFGLNRLPIDPEVRVETLMLKAANECIDAANIDRNQIKYLIHAHTASHGSPYGSSSVMELQRRLNLGNALSFGTTMSKCGSVFVSFKLAKDLFKHLNDEDYILILTGDVSFTEVLQYIPGTTITTDGACAILLTKRDVCNKLIGIEIDIHGEFAGGIWDEKESAQLFEKNYSKYLSEVISNVISNSQLTLEDIKLILPHNVNTMSWREVIKLLKISADKVFLENIGEMGHCFGTDPFLNYKVALDKGCIKKGDYFIFSTVGLGATFAAMLFQH